MPGIFVDPDASIEDSKDNMYNLMFYEAIIITVLNIPGYIFFREKPLTPPR